MLWTLFGRWRQRHLTLAPEVLLHEVLEESGYMDLHGPLLVAGGQRTPDAEGRIGNLEELINALAEFANLEEFLEHIALIMDFGGLLLHNLTIFQNYPDILAADNVGTSGAVMLMTLHASKGLEFDTVFAPGWEEGLFPSERSGIWRYAVLVRTNAQTREIEERFNRAGVPYRVIGAKFYERQEIRDAIAYLRRPVAWDAITVEERLALRMWASRGARGGGFICMRSWASIRIENLGAD